MPHPSGPTNRNVKKLVVELKRTKDRFYLGVARSLEKSRRSKKPVNIGKLKKLSKKYDSFIVPGKVLGIGDIDKAVDVYAWAFSKDAGAKIKKAGGNAFPLAQIIKDNAKGRVVL